jgi:hypothetical protein
MTSKSAARPNDGGEVNPKIDPAPNSNTEKEPDDWASIRFEASALVRFVSKLSGASHSSERVLR